MAHKLDTISSPRGKAANACQHLFTTVLMNMKNKPDVDWNLVAEKAGYKTAASAHEMFRRFMRESKRGSHPINGLLPKPQPPKDARIGTPPTPSKVEITTPTNTGRKRNFSSENDEKGSGKRQRIKKEAGSGKESNVLVQKVQKQRRARSVLSDDSDVYGEA